jgi:polygalacturonase
MKGLIGLVCLLLGIVNLLSARTYDINTYGAEADGKTLNTAAIQKAINACTPGDTVLIPAGRYLTGTVHLKSNITLYLEKESALVGSARLADYESFADGNITRYNGILSTTGAENVSITGSGAIEGNSPAFVNVAAKASTVDTALLKYTRQQDNYRNGNNALVTLSNHPQHMVEFAGCKNITISNVSLRNAAGTALSFVACERVLISGISIESQPQILATTGIQVVGCKQVVIKGSSIHSGGDAIAINGLRSNDAPPGTAQSQNIVISNCLLQSSSTAIDIQSLDQSSITGVQVSHVNILPSGRGVGLMLRNAGSLEDISFNNVYIESKLGFGSQETNGEPIHISAVAGADSVKLGAISNVAFNNVFCVGENQILLYGSAQSMLRNIQFNDMVFYVKSSTYNDTMGGNVLLWANADKKQRLFAANLPAVMANYVQGLSFNNIKISWTDARTPAYFTAGIGVSNFKEIKLNRCDVKPAPLSRNSHAVELLNGSLATIDAGDVSRINVQDSKPLKGGSKPFKAKIVRK